MEVLSRTAATIRNHPCRSAVILAGGLLLSGCSSDRPVENRSSEGALEALPSSSPSVDATTTASIKPDLCDPTTVNALILPDGNTAYCAQQQATGGADVFTSFADASGKVTKLSEGARILISCVQRGPEEAAPSAKGLWYEIAEPQELEGTYVAANAFWNVTDFSIPFEQQPAVDPRIPDCPR